MRPGTNVQLRAGYTAHAYKGNWDMQMNLLLLRSRRLQSCCRDTDARDAWPSGGRSSWDLGRYIHPVSGVLGDAPVRAVGAEASPCGGKDASQMSCVGFG